MYTTVSHAQKTVKKTNIGIVDYINQWIEKNGTNYFGICGMMLIAGTALTSIPVAIATSLQMFVIVAICAILAMSVNVMVISQQKLKTIVWTFLIGMTINTLLMIFLVWFSFV